MGHRRVGELSAIVASAPLSPWVRQRALEALRLLGEAEGRVHGVPADDVLLHEVGALDALVDIVGGIEGFEQLGITRIYSKPVAVGDGWVRAAHGVMAVPAPATAILLEGLAVGPNGPVSGEATTPTGAVLLRVLTGGPPPNSWRIQRSGWGAGGRNPAGYANAMRLLLADGAEQAADVVILATDLDDLTPEYLEPLRAALMEAGALDVQLWATQMKKGRIGFRLEALAAPEHERGVTAALFRHSTTAGIRRWPAERTILPRRELTLEYHGEPVRMKILETPAGPRVKPEFDDIAEAASRTGIPAFEVARELQSRAVRLLSGDSGTDGTREITSEGTR